MNQPLRSAAALVVAATLTLSLTACSSAGSGETKPADPANPVSAATTPAVETDKPDASKPVDGPKPAHTTKEPIENLTVRWEAGINAYLLLYGIAHVPDLHVEVRSGSTILSQADVQVKDGRFLATLNDPGVGVAAELSLSTLGPDGKVVATLPVPQERHVGTAWSTNFQKVTARQLDPQTVQVSGLARAFEGVFEVQVQVDGQVKGSKQVKAAQGAPAYSEFEEKISLDQPLPQEGVEVYLLTQSPKDGSSKVELYTNVSWGK